MTDLQEVITVNPTGGAYGPTARPFGQTFTDRTAATAYARDMRRLGFETTVSPVFNTTANAIEALRIAAVFYDSGDIAKAADDRQNHAAKEADQ